MNEDIDRLRHAATRALFEKHDTVIVASVSCIYGLGLHSRMLSVVEYGAASYRRGRSDKKVFAVQECRPNI